MKAAGATVVMLLVAGSGASGHRLDEYLQATRVAIGRSQLILEVDLTPGSSIASGITEALDADANAAISPVEAEVYGRAVLADVIVKLDENPIAMKLTRIEVPTIEEMRNGLGTIRMRAAGTIEAGMGRHHLYFLNNHRPQGSVYMVNALMPEDREVTLGPQSRDPRQREYRTEYTVTPRWIAQILWLGLGVAGLALAVVAKRNEKRKRKNE